MADPIPSNFAAIDGDITMEEDLNRAFIGNPNDNPGEESDDDCVIVLGSALIVIPSDSMPAPVPWLHV